MIRLLSPLLILASLVTSLTAAPFVLDKRQRDQLKKETVYAIDLIQRYHYKQKSFADIDSEALLRAYMEDLDATRLFLLQEDIDFAIERFGTSLKPSYLFVGDLYPAFEVFNVYHRRPTPRGRSPPPRPTNCGSSASPTN